MVAIRQRSSRRAAVLIKYWCQRLHHARDATVRRAAASPHLDTVEVDSPLGAVFFGAPAQLANSRRRLDSVEQVALNPNESRDLILGIAGEL